MNRRDIVFIVSLLLLGFQAHSQIPTAGDGQQNTITVKGRLEGGQAIKGRDGSDHFVVVCSCSEQTCYTLSTGVDGIAGQTEDLDCAGRGLEAAVPRGTKIKITVNGQSIEGELEEYRNQSDGTNVLTREHHFTLKKSPEN
jgi:hypothetical protein